MHYFWMIAGTLFILQSSVFFTTIYLHRSQTHRGLDLHPVIAGIMHLELALFTGIQTREWVAVHRKHHHFSDQEGDPHSPYIFGVWQVLLGNFWLYRTEKRKLSTIRKYTPDYVPDWVDHIPGIRFAPLAGLAMFTVSFGLLWGAWWVGAAAWFLHVVAYILLNSMINSLCHAIGYRNFENLATNIQWVALLTAGEGLHNNHHEYPSSARFALRGREIDPAWPLIRLLTLFGLARVRRESATLAA